MMSILDRLSLEQWLTLAGTVVPAIISLLSWKFRPEQLTWRVFAFITAASVLVWLFYAGIMTRRHAIPLWVLIVVSLILSFMGYVVGTIRHRPVEPAAEPVEAPEELDHIKIMGVAFRWQLNRYRTVITPYCGNDECQAKLRAKENYDGKTGDWSTTFACYICGAENVFSGRIEEIEQVVMDEVGRRARLILAGKVTVREAREGIKSASLVKEKG